MANRRTSQAPAGTLTLHDLNRATLARQMLLARERIGVVEAVERLAGMQAQYSPSPYIGLWTRLEEFRIDDLTAALLEREVVKASLMRWTLHLASARDYPYFARTIAESRTAVWRPNAERAGVDGPVLHAKLLEFATQPRHVDEMLEFLDAQAQLPPDPNRYPYTVWHAASARGWLVHVPPSGSWKYFGKNSYISTREWLGQTEEPPLSEALTHLVGRYLAAFGPATRADVVSWAGLRKVSQVDEALYILGDEVLTFQNERGKTLYDLEASPRPGGDVPAPPRFLPKWDNLLLAYEDRERVLPDRYRKIVIRKNGDVLPTFLVNGVVAGIWSVKLERKIATLLIEPFEEISPEASDALEQEGTELVRFMEPDAESYRVRINTRK
ncbi:MAG TPA: winged helix DNA-binding domain-containing protein [Chloroflexia bacterium]|nr:winged helix DNA-binding domain-containing protein [Chloroflexia bacterium]